MAGSALEYVVSHWSKLIENFSTSSDEFYDAVGAALARREVPDAPMYRIQWSEGGVLSPNREYFRIVGSGFTAISAPRPSGRATSRDIVEHFTVRFGKVDDRLDRMDTRFERLEREMREGFRQVDIKLDAVMELFATRKQLVNLVRELGRRE